MNSSSERTRPIVWCWRRWIAPAQQDIWIGRVQGIEGLFWAMTERPNRTRLLLAAYPKSRAEAEALFRKWGGQVRAEKVDDWIKQTASPPLPIARKFVIVDETALAPGDGNLPHLRIPHGMAFGSGEHATTLMLLRALANHEMSGRTVLDLGTGSGVLALAARLLGARKIVATDFDAIAVKTARENEVRNFAEPLVRWRQADVKQLRVAARYDLILANLFSGILVEAASRIAASLAPGGELWLSGVLRSQEKEVNAAYRRQKLQPIRTVRRGKWLMLQWRAP